ncbi:MULTISPECIES: YceG family protein [unclassified Clostridium]|uniref:YceG family protein n=1 Tax=unclassified Clostridium TaxID=2614128 RepID=UPI0025C59F84|nr:MULTISPECIES: YceG family protein [unclassified Clostridium]
MEDKGFVLKKSNDIFRDILLTRKERKISNSDNNEYIYGYRYIGLNNESEYYSEIIKLNSNLSKLGNIYIHFEDKINIPYDLERTNKIKDCINNASLNGFFIDNIVEALYREGILKINNFINKNIKEALIRLINLYMKNEGKVNSSLIVSFISKIIFWLYEYIPKSFCYDIKEHNPKVLYYGNIKKHEAYFLILLSLIGYDVLYINSDNDNIFSSIDYHNEFILTINNKNRVEVKEITLEHGTDVSSDLYDEGKSPKVLLVKSKDIFKDIFTTLKAREGYLQNQVYPIYFERYIGIENENSDMYYNNLYKLDKKLKEEKYNYLKFENKIAVPSNEEATKYIGKIKKKINLLDIKDKNKVITEIISLNILPRSNKEEINLRIKASFIEILHLYLDVEENLNISKLQNFVMKLICWINRYSVTLHNNFNEEHNGKIIYYGEIKAHEIYFLIYASLVGCDIVYISPREEDDSLYNILDKQEKYTFLTKLDSFTPLENFPVIERTIIKETVAYRASKELEELLGTDVGYYKPRQLNESLTKSVLLKTTYDEMKILWKETGKIRPHFKVENNIVYIPNIFAKINGTHEDLEEYWRDFKELSSNSNTLTINTVPFTEIRYSRQDKYSIIYFLDRDGLLDFNKVQNSDLYKFKYLSDKLQNLILSKINELILLNPFNREMENEFKLNIIMTVLNISDNILKLIETFDYTSYIPKVIIYDNTKDFLSEEDIITLAYLNIIGMDIAVFTPTNYKNIEILLKENAFKSHNLPSVRLDLSMPNLEKKRDSFISKLFRF